MDRRGFIKIAGVTPAMGLISPHFNYTSFSPASNARHSVCRWCYNNTPLELLIDKAKDLGIQSIELLNPDEWELVYKSGLECAVANGSPLGITVGFNDLKNHDQLFKDFEKFIPMAADHGIPNIICFSGNRRQISDAEGLENCAVGLDPVVKLAERYNIRVIMELLNSRVDHQDYQCDNTAWGIQLVDKLGSENFKLLYDIYHMQIMEGDIIRTIQNHKDYIAHFHTGGVPGRNEIDETQELNYAAIISGIMETGYEGFVAQEFIPTWEDPFSALKVAIDICTV